MAMAANCQDANVVLRLLWDGEAATKVGFRLSNFTNFSFSQPPRQKGVGVLDAVGLTVVCCPCFMLCCMLCCWK